MYSTLFLSADLLMLPKNPPGNISGSYCKATYKISTLDIVRNVDIKD